MLLSQEFMTVSCAATSTMFFSLHTQNITECQYFGQRVNSTSAESALSHLNKS